MDRTFQEKTYEIRSVKVSKPLTLVFFSDLHARMYGPGNIRIIETVRQAKPDLILCGGDLAVARNRQVREGAELLKALRQIAPVYAGYGNHESELKAYPGLLQQVRDELAASGVSFLSNATEKTVVKEQRVAITSLELPLSSYRKLRRPRFSAEDMMDRIGNQPDSDAYSILLAHNPYFMPLYFSWKADLILSGHYHGGVMRFGRHGVLISPYGFPFPKYGYGHYHRGNSDAVVTSGLGEHVLPLRVHNPFELVVIHVKPC